jgi:hypothetical protein
VRDERDSGTGRVFAVSFFQRALQRSNIHESPGKLGYYKCNQGMLPPACCGSDFQIQSKLRACVQHAESYAL